eukprot:TRINITY_DN49767_c0_g1_i1.p2 TRINITY_DN49767_c0_g1~~TRINITY_DN49767_c0_g1_i1.p2  ORF type:complete len:305 (+),score=53.12 TRINITY_DN49767_c0_g1_i1:100-915(+)
MTDSGVPRGKRGRNEEGMQGESTALSSTGSQSTPAEAAGAAAPAPPTRRGGRPKGRGKGQGRGRGHQSQGTGSINESSFWIADPGARQAVAILAKQLCKVSLQQRRMIPRVFDAIDLPRECKLAKAATSEHDAVIQKIRDGLIRDPPPVAVFVTLSFLEALKDEEVGMDIRQSVSSFLESVEGKDLMDLGDRLGFVIETPQDQTRVRFLLGLRDCAELRATVLDGLRRLKGLDITVHRSVPPPPGFLENQVSTIANLLTSPAQQSWSNHWG